MKTAALVVALLVTGTTGVTLAVREPPLVEGKSPEQFVRSEIERAARLEFDTLMEQLFAHERGLDEQRKVAIARIKLAMYNKSYINFKCWLSAIFDAQETGRETLDQTKLEDCAKGPLSRLYTNYKIWVDYRSLAIARATPARNAAFASSRLSATPPFGPGDGAL